MDDGVNGYQKAILSCIERDNLGECKKNVARLNSPTLDWLNYFINDDDGIALNYIIKKKAVNIFNWLLDTYSMELFSIKEPTHLDNVIHMAFEEGYCEIIQALLNTEEYVEFSKDIEGNNELHKWAFRHFSCEKCLASLARHKKYKSEYLTDQNYKGNTPLHNAVIEGNLKCCSLLIKYFQFDFKVIGENGNTLLHMACKHNNVKLLELFSNRNIDVNIKNNENESCLTVALGNEHFQMAEKILEMDIKISNKDKSMADSLQGISLSLAKKIKAMKSEQDKQIRSTSKPSKSNCIRGSKSTLNVNVLNLNSNSSKSDQQIEVEINSSVNTGKACSTSVTKLASTGGFHTKFLQNALQDSSSNDSTNKSTVDDTPGSPFIRGTTKQHSGKREIPCNPTINPFNKNANSNNSNHAIILSPLRTKLPEKTIECGLLSSRGQVSSLQLTQSCDSNQGRSSSNGKVVIQGDSNKDKGEMEPPNFRVPLYNDQQIIHTLINFEYMKSFITLNVNDIKLGEMIHQADSCRVYKGKYLGLPVAVKVYNVSQLKEEEMKCFVSEINLLMSLRHPNIVTFIGTCTKDNTFYLVTEYMDKKSLKSVLEDKKIDLPISIKLKFCLDIALGVYYLHTRNPTVLHRDLKSSNVLVDSSGKVKLCDFGLSKTIEHFTQITTNSTSTPYWMAPEYILDGMFTDKSDVYSFGILMWEVMMRDTVPYKGKSNFDILLADKESLKKRPYVPPDFNSDIKDLMNKCWHGNYNLRPNFEEIIEILENLLTKNKFDK